MFPEDDAVWSTENLTALAPLRIDAFRNFVLVPEAILRLISRDVELIGDVSEFEFAYEFYTESLDYGRMQFDEDKALETRFSALSSENMKKIKAGHASIDMFSLYAYICWL